MNVVRIFILWVSLLALLCSCHRATPEPLPRKVAVFDFEFAQPPETEKTIKGWWFGARDLYFNPNADILFADFLADELSRALPYVSVYPRLDLKYYFASKAARLTKAYPNLSDNEIRELMKEVPLEEYGRDLLVDKIITGTVFDCYMSHQRTIHSWRSTLDVEIKVIDAETGNVDWEYRCTVKKTLGSRLAVLEKAARQLTQRLHKEYFL